MKGFGAFGNGAPLKLPLVLRVDEVFAMFEKAKKCNVRDFKILMLLYYFGMRNNEMTSLRREDIDLKSMTIKILDAKGGKDRMVPIVEFNTFVGRDDKTIADYLAMWVGYDTTGPIIEGDSEDGGISDRTVRRIVKHYAVLCNVTRAAEVHPHTLRHCYATHLNNMGVPLDMVQKLLGHSNIQTTQIYAHMGVEQLRLMMKKMWEIVQFRQQYPLLVKEIEKEPDPIKRIEKHLELNNRANMILLGSSS